MALLFFRLRGVPDDEADEIRQILTDNAIDFYETNAGNWGISLPAIWLSHQDDEAKARLLFDEYQRQRAGQQRAIYLELKRQGKQPGFWRHNLNRPFRFLAYCLILTMVIYISIKWLYELGL
jgi:hypothetical protein